MARREAVATCVFCRRHPVAAEWRPFCSERCKLQDLAHWAGGDYRVAAETVDDPDDPEHPENPNDSRPGGSRREP